MCAVHLMHITLLFQEKLILNFYFLADEVIGFVQTAETINFPVMCLWAKNIWKGIYKNDNNRI